MLFVRRSAVRETADCVEHDRRSAPLLIHDEPLHLLDHLELHSRRLDGLGQLSEAAGHKGRL